MSVSNVLFVGLQKPFSVAIAEPRTVKELKVIVFPDHLSSDSVYLCNGGCPLNDNDIIYPSSDVLVLSAHSRLRGGKGGFGSLIRATGSHRNKNANRSACRDISGRRVRDIKDEKKMAEWMADEKKRKRERAERKKRRLQRLLEEPKHKFEDTSYMNSIRSTAEGMSDSLKQGLEQDTTSVAGPATGPVTKRPKLWMHSEELSSSEDEEQSSASDSSDLSSSEETPPDNTTTTNTPPAAASTLSPAASTLPASTLPPAGNSPPAASTLPASTLPPAGNSPPVSSDDVMSTGTVPPAAATTSHEEIDLSQFSTVEDLLAVGGEALKISLASLGLKCGGTPLERAQRLFSIKGLTQQQIPNKLWAKKKKKMNSLIKLL